MEDIWMISTVERNCELSMSSQWQQQVLDDFADIRQVLSDIVSRQSVHMPSAMPGAGGHKDQVRVQEKTSSFT